MPSDRQTSHLTRFSRFTADHVSLKAPLGRDALAVIPDAEKRLHDFRLQRPPVHAPPSAERPPLSVSRPALEQPRDTGSSRRERAVCVEREDQRA